MPNPESGQFHEDAAGWGATSSLLGLPAIPLLLATGADLYVDGDLDYWFLPVGAFGLLFLSFLAGFASGAAKGTAEAIDASNKAVDDVLNGK